MRQGTKLRLASLKNIPIFFLGGGGIKSSFPKKGLFGLVCSSQKNKE